jgi:hypothetical protein
MVGYADEKMALSLKWLRRKERNLLERMRNWVHYSMASHSHRCFLLRVDLMKGERILKCLS